MNCHLLFIKDERCPTFYENLVDTASPTVTVLRDSILIGYQNEKRTIHIYVPPNYDKDSLTRYPVIYFLDGNSSFNDLENRGPEWQIDEVINAASANGKQTAIVVGINHVADIDTEYAPFVNEDNSNAHGDKFAKWLTTDLKNWIDTKCRYQVQKLSMKKAQGMDEDALRFELIANGGYWNVAWRESFALCYP